MMHFVFMERLSKTDTYEWIGLLPTHVLRELLRPYVKEFRGEPKTRDGLKRKLEYIEQITAIDPNLFNEYAIPECVDKIPAPLLHRLAPVLARVKDDIRTKVWGEGVV
ncbi:MAG: hypothetical protein K6T83_22960, partial [Alicyclobacillus sp.]|nr:hypothetical protein [Alicyclobacillus sp.]